MKLQSSLILLLLWQVADSISSSQSVTMDATASASISPSYSATATSSETPSSSASPSSFYTPSSTSSSSPSPSSFYTASPTASSSPSPSTTATSATTATGSATASSSVSASQLLSISPTASATPSSSASSSPTASPTATPSPSASGGASDALSPSPSAKMSSRPSATSTSAASRVQAVTARAPMYAFLTSTGPLISTNSILSLAGNRNDLCLLLASLSSNIIMRPPLWLTAPQLYTLSLFGGPAIYVSLDAIIDTVGGWSYTFSPPISTETCRNPALPMLGVTVASTFTADSVVGAARPSGSMAEGGAWDSASLAASIEGASLGLSWRINAPQIPLGASAVVPNSAGVSVLASASTITLLMQEAEDRVAAALFSSVGNASITEQTEAATAAFLEQLAILASLTNAMSETGEERNFSFLSVESLPVTLEAVGPPPPPAPLLWYQENKAITGMAIGFTLLGILVLVALVWVAKRLWEGDLSCDFCSRQQGKYGTPAPFSETGGTATVVNMAATASAAAPAPQPSTAASSLSRDLAIYAPANMKMHPMQALYLANLHAGIRSVRRKGERRSGRKAPASPRQDGASVATSSPHGSIRSSRGEEGNFAHVDISNPLRLENAPSPLHPHQHHQQPHHHERLHAGDETVTKALFQPTIVNMSGSPTPLKPNVSKPSPAHLLNSYNGIGKDFPVRASLRVSASPHSPSSPSPVKKGQVEWGSNGEGLSQTSSIMLRAQENADKLLRTQAFLSRKRFEALSTDNAEALGDAENGVA